MYSDTFFPVRIEGAPVKLRTGRSGTWHAGIRCYTGVPREINLDQKRSGGS
jgi:hypothetical protein